MFPSHPGLFLAAAALALVPVCQADPLPLAKTFRGKSTFDHIVGQAVKENWKRLPMGDRVARFGRAMVGTPYVGFSLEIDDHIESPSADFTGQDCWTFFEIALGLARMVEVKRPPYHPADLLKQIEHTRYRNGHCGGDYLERIHYLVEWYANNHRRRNIVDLTGKLGGVPFPDRQLTEMSRLWRHYRYLRENPELRPRMAESERQISRMKVRYIPKDRVQRIESKLASGDIIGIATHKPVVFCSHVGLAIKMDDGRIHLMHASSDRKKVIIDDTLHNYLHRYKKHAGILVGRPLPVRAGR